MDCWRVYEIKSDGTLGIENEIFPIPLKRKEILKKQYEKLKERIKKCITYKTNKLKLQIKKILVFFKPLI